MLTRDEKSVKKFLFSNSVVYNRQYLNFEKCVEKMIDDISPDEKTALIFSDIFYEQTVYSLLGRGKFSTYHWDQKRKDIVLNEDCPTLNIFNGYKDFEMVSDQYDTIYYVVFPFEEEKQQLERIEEHIRSERIYSYGLWEIKLYQLMQI